MERAVVFGVSGYSGAGRTPSPRNDVARLAGNVLPYRLAGHGHTAEIARAAGCPVRFLPHVAGFARGLIVTATVTLQHDAAAVDALRDQYRAWAAAEPLLTFTDDPPRIPVVVDTPGAAIGGLTADPDAPGEIAICCAIDNLLKGAASQALQNINIALGFAELEGVQHDHAVATGR